MTSADRAAGGKIGAWQDFHQVVDGGVGDVDQPHDRIGHFAQVVWRDTGRHADGDAVGTVDEQIGKLRWQNDRLHVALVVRRHKVDRVAVDVFQHVRSDRRETGLGVSHGGWRQACE